MIETLSAILDAATSLPTVVFTVLLVPVVLYWALSFGGLFSLDWLDGADGAADGALDGALDGAADGALDGATDGVLHGSADGAFGHLDGLHEVDLGDLHDFDSIGHGGFGHIPKSLVGSLLVVFGWTISLLGSLFVPGFQELATGGLVFAGLLTAGVFLLALGATLVALRPLANALVATLGPTRRQLIGRTCTVKTNRVDEAFGQAEVDGGDAHGGQLVQVRSRSGQDFAFGQKGLIFDYDASAEVFLIAHLDGLVASIPEPEPT